MAEPILETYQIESDIPPPAALIGVQRDVGDEVACEATLGGAGIVPRGNFALPRSLFFCHPVKGPHLGKPPGEPIGIGLAAAGSLPPVIGPPEAPVILADPGQGGPSRGL